MEYAERALPRSQASRISLCNTPPHYLPITWANRLWRDAEGCSRRAELVDLTPDETHQKDIQRKMLGKGGEGNFATVGLLFPVPVLNDRDNLSLQLTATAISEMGRFAMSGLGEGGARSGKKSGRAAASCAPDSRLHNLHSQISSLHALHTRRPEYTTGGQRDRLASCVKFCASGVDTSSPVLHGVDTSSPVLQGLDTSRS